MAERSLRGCRVLVVEDEYMLADDLRQELEDAGAIVVGPAQSVERALSLLESPDNLDGAILDVNLRGEMAYPVADALVSQGVPFVFTTGYDASVLPRRFEKISRCEKPINMRRVAEAIGRVIHSSDLT